MRYLNPIQQSRDIVQEFRGYNHNLRISEGEWYDEENMSSDFYPVMSPRRPRIYDETSGINGMIALGSDDIFYTRNRKLYRRNFGGEVMLYDYSALSDVSDVVPRSLVAFGAFIVIFPDGIYYNTIAPDEKGSIDAEFQANGAAYSICDVDGTNYGDMGLQIIVGPSAPDPLNISVDENTRWLDTSEDKNPKLWRYSNPYGWQQVEPVYVKMESANIAKDFVAGDSVKISGSPADLDWLDGDHIIIGKHESIDAQDVDSIWFEGCIDVVGISTGSTAKVERKAPIMDFVTEANNRLWGCRHGNNRAGDFVNEIYACKLGDFKNWTTFESISTDSYIASVGSYGDFTGAVTYLGYPIFFKENCLHKVYGTVPANFQINTAACNGVVAGAAGSIAICDARVYYKSRAGVCVYDGSLPQDISAVFGGDLYNGVDIGIIPQEWESWALHRAGACGGADDYKYYLSCCSDKDHKWNLFVYDTRTGIWHREDNSHITAIVFGAGDVHYTDGEKFYKMNDDAGEDVTWYAESGEIGLLLPDKQYVAKIVLKMACALGAQMDISIQYDGVGEWQHVETVHGTGVSSQSVAVKPERCAFFRLRFSGIGDVKLYGYIKSTETGSDI